MLIGLAWLSALTIAVALTYRHATRPLSLRLAGRSLARPPEAAWRREITVVALALIFWRTWSTLRSLAVCAILRLAAQVLA